MALKVKARVDTGLAAEIYQLQKALEWMESWHKENIDGRHHCPWCYLSGQDKDGNDLDWKNINHHTDCLIGRALVKT